MLDSTRRDGRERNKSVCRTTSGTESSHSGPVGAFGLIAVHGALIYRSKFSWHISDESDEYDQKCIRTLCTTKGKDSMSQEPNCELNQQGEQRAFRTAGSKRSLTVELTYLFIYFILVAPASSVDTEHPRPSTSSGILEHVAARAG